MQSDPIIILSKTNSDQVADNAHAVAEQMLYRFSIIEDPREERGKRYPLTEMLFMAFVGVLCGGNDWETVHAFCDAQQAWFRQFLKMKHGVPTVRTFERVFEVSNSKVVEACLNDLLAALIEHSHGTRLKDKVIAVDGKTLRGSFCQASEQNALHLLHAFGTESGVVLGQEEVGDKENEIPAIPRVLEPLDIQGRTITADAMGCQREVAETVTKKKGNYVLALKGNHPNLHQHVIKRFDFAERMQFDKSRMGEPFGHHHHRTVDKGHGRIEERSIDTLDATGDWFHEQHPGWRSVQSVIRITSHRTIGMDTTTECRYYISSHPAEQDRLIASCIRAHWCIENNLHWCLDTAFNEDKSRIRKGHGPLNFAVFRRVVMTTLKKDKSKKKSLKVKRFLAALQPDYRMKLLGF